MLRHFYSYTNHFPLCLTQNCALRCINCSLWKGAEKHEYDFKALIKSQKFFQKFPYCKTYHILGGDPVMHTQIKYILSFLKTNQIKIWLFTTGLYESETLKQLSSYVDRFFIQLPSPSESDYRDSAGYNGFNEFNQTIRFLKEQKRDVTITFLVTPMTIQLLPEFYELCLSYRLPGLIHYNPKDHFSYDSIAYIDRFFNIKNFSVYKNNHPTPKYCPHYACGLSSLPQRYKNAFLNNLIWLFNRL